MRVVAIFLLAGLPVLGADNWIRMTTPHFEIYTTGPEARARDTLRYCEELRDLFTQLPEFSTQREVPVRVIEFATREQFRLYSGNEWEAGYYRPAGARDYIAILAAESGRSALLTHEYVHFLTQHSGKPHPLWESEGISEVFASAMVGGKIHPKPAGQWMPIERLMALEKLDGLSAPEIDQFYYESQALVHMMRSSGHKPEDDDALRRWIIVRDGGGMPEIAIAAKMTESAMEPALYPVSAFESSFMLAQLLSVTGRHEEAATALRELNDSFADVLEHLADVTTILRLAALESETSQGADRVLAALNKALTLTPEDQEIRLQLARAYYEKARPPVRRFQRSAPVNADALRKALELKPDYAPALVLLGTSQLDEKDYDAAFATFGKVHEVSSELFDGYLRLAQVFRLAERFSEGDECLKLARQLARTDAEKVRADRITQSSSSWEKAAK